MARIASFVHKWLALIVGLQILVWIGTGLFFTLVPIEQVRSEHRIRQLAPVALTNADAEAVQTILSSSPTPVRFTIESRPEGARLVADYADGSTALFDARTGQKLSPLSAEAAVATARARIIASTQAMASTTFVNAESPEYRGPLPAWRIAFQEPDNLAVFVSANSGQVTARRSDLWRLYDTLWALHIMDWRDHENFNHIPIIVVSALALLSALAGVALIPYRFRWRRRSPPE